MNVANLVLQYVRALVWPVVVALAIVAFRHEARGLLGRLKSLGAPGFSAEFDSEVKSTLESAKAALALEERDDGREAEGLPVGANSAMPEYRLIEQIIAIDPTAAVRAAWSLVESRLNEVAGPVPPAFFSRTNKLIKSLADKGFEPIVVMTAQSLYKLHDEAVNQLFGVKPATARNFVDTARVLLTMIDDSVQRR